MEVVLGHDLLWDLILLDIVQFNGLFFVEFAFRSSVFVGLVVEGVLSALL